MLTSCVLGLAAGYGEHQARTYINSVCLGPEGPAIDAGAFAKALSSRGMPNAVPAPVVPAKPKSEDAPPWWEAPKWAKAEQWVTVVTTGFGTRGDAFVFRFAGPDGALSFLAHHPYEQFSRWGSLVWPDPLPGLAEAFERASKDQARIERPPLRLEIRAHGAKQEDRPASLEAPEEGIGSEALKAMQADKLLPPLEAMAWAGAWLSGWAPKRSEAEQRIAIEIDFGLKMCSFLAKYAGPFGETTMLREDVPEEQLQLELARLFLYFARQKDLRHYGRLPHGDATLMHAGQNRLCYQSRGVLFGFDTARNKLLWPKLPEDGKLPKAQAFTAQLGPDGRPTIFRTSGVLAAVDPETGLLQELRPQGTAQTQAFAFVEGGAILVGQGQQVRCVRNGELVWECDAGSRVTCGPVVSGNRAVFGTARGGLVAVDTATGDPVWKAPQAPELQGRLIVAGANVVGFDRRAETLRAWRLEDGTSAWAFSLGDVLLQLQPIGQGRILAAAKNNRIAILDGDTGKLCHERVWHTWPLQVIPVNAGARALLAVADLDGAISLLDQDDLKTVRTVEPLAALSRSMLFVDDLALSRPDTFPDAALAGGDLADLGTQPSLVLTDRQGFYYIVALHQQAE